MKHLILLFAILLQTNFCDAQKIRFTDTSNKWTFQCFTDPPVFFYSMEYKYAKDSVINGETYFELQGFFANDKYLIRDDTANRKIFMWDAANSKDALIMDFNLGLNDTLKIKDFNCIVIKEDSIVINSIWHKKLEFEAYNNFGQLQQQIIRMYEGIGCSGDNPLYHLNPTLPYFHCSLCLFTNKGDTISPFNYCTLLPINDVDFQTTILSVFPNPLKPQSKILLPYKISSGSLSIYDFTGRKIYSKEFLQREELHIGDLNFTPGIYFLQVKDLMNGKVFTEKFVQQ